MSSQSTGPGGAGDGYKVVAVRLRPDIGADFEDIAAALEINQGAMLAAAVEIWVDRWRAAGGRIEEFTGTESGNPVLRQRWEQWIAIGRRIEAERLSRDHLRVERVNVMVRLDTVAARYLRQLSDLLGPQMQTSVLTALIETWTEYWNLTGIEPGRVWPPGVPEPEWWDRWCRWCDTAERQPKGRHGKRKSVVVRLSPYMAADFARLVDGTGMTRTAVLQGLLVMAAEDWGQAGVAPTLAWRRKKAPPEWWGQWLVLMERARRIGAERRGEEDDA